MCWQAGAAYQHDDVTGIDALTVAGLALPAGAPGIEADVCNGELWATMKRTAARCTRVRGIGPSSNASRCWGESASIVFR